MITIRSVERSLMVRISLRFRSSKASGNGDERLIKTNAECHKET